MQFLDKIESFIEKYRWFLISIGIAGVIFYTLFFLQFTADDSWITYRYAKNLIGHGIWNWNPDRTNPTEAYTSFSYAFLAIFPILIKIEPSVFFKIFGLAIFFVIIYKIRKRAINNAAFILGFYAMAFNFYFFVHLYSGLETPLFILLIFETMLVLSGNKETNERYLFSLLLLLPLTRPEGMVYSLAAFIFFLARNKLKVKDKLFLAVVILAGISYMIGRTLYFGQLLPNPYYVKNIYSMAHAMNAFGRSIPIIIVLMILASLLQDKIFSLFTISSLIIFSFAYAPSQLLMNFADRFRFQIFFPLILFSAVSLKRKYQLLIVPLFLICFWPMYADFNYFSWLKYYGPVLNRAYKDLGLRLSQFKDRNYTFLLGDAGVLPYYSEWKCYDSLGLTDKKAAQEGLTGSRLKYLSPELICLHSQTPNETGLMKDPNQYSILHYLKNSRQYVMAGGFRVFNYYVLFYLKKNIASFDEIKKEIEDHQTKVKYLYSRITLNNILLQKYIF